LKLPIPIITSLKVVWTLLKNISYIFRLYTSGNKLAIFGFNNQVEFDLEKGQWELECGGKKNN